MSTTLARARTRLLEGPHRWGTYEINAGRAGVVHYRLAVYPPGTNAIERRALARAREWPIVGGVGALVAIIVFGGTVGPVPLMTAVMAIYVAGIAWTRSRTRHLRRAVRVADAVVVNDGGRNVSRGELSLILTSIASLRALDENSARPNEVAYEARWAEVYRTIGEFSAGSIRQP